MFYDVYYKIKIIFNIILLKKHFKNVILERNYFIGMGLNFLLYSNSDIIDIGDEMSCN
jgi:hypothetical protein